MRSTKFQYAIHLLNLVVIAIFLVHYMNRAYPMVGHDFSYFIPRLLDTHLHHRINGLEIQWYTPSFGGGLPAYPNPQHIQFSLPQLLLFVMDPWLTILVSAVCFACIGYFSCYFLLHHTLSFSWQASALGSLLFALNGFYLNHMTVGHLGYLGYPLLPLIPISLLMPRMNPILGASILSIALSCLVYGAGFYVVVIFTLSMMLGLPIIYLVQPVLLRPKKMLAICAVAIPLTLALTGSKIYAVQSLMHLFPRQIYDPHQVTMLTAFIGVVLQLSAATIINPIRFLVGKNPDDLPGILAALSGPPFGIWELDTSLPAILLIGVFVGVLLKIAVTLKTRTWPTVDQWLALIFLAISANIAMELAATRGAIYEFAKSLPFFRSFYANPRFTAAFILPLILLGTYFLNAVMNRFSRRNLLLITVYLCTIGSIATYYLLSPKVHDRSFNVSSSLAVYKMVETGETFPVKEIAKVDDADSFIRRASSLRPYEPVFGYKWEQFSAKTVEGSVFLQDGEFLNMTNPASLVFPQARSTGPFERIKVAEIEKLRAFVERKQPDWNIPVVATVLNWIALIVIVLELIILSVFATRNLVHRSRPALAVSAKLSQTES